MTEQGSMGIAQNTGDRNRRIQKTVQVRHTERRIGTDDLRKSRFRNTKGRTERWIPSDSIQIHQLVTAGIRRVRAEPVASREPEYQIAVDRAQRQLASSGRLFHLRAVLKQPCHLGSRIVRR